MIVLKGLFAKLKAELAFVVLLAVASAGAYFYVRAERAIADRDADVVDDALQHIAQALLALGGWWTPRAAR